jgi:hypothetical protein
MFHFTVQGRIGRLGSIAREGFRISIAADRLADGPQGRYTRTEWLSCICFDAKMNARLEADLEVGMNVKLEGRIEPRKREVDGVTLYDTSFFIDRFERLSKPKTLPEKREPAESPPGDEPATAAA